METTKAGWLLNQIQRFERKKEGKSGKKQTKRNNQVDLERPGSI